jgi:hypothetical protein
MKTHVLKKPETTRAGIPDGTYAKPLPTFDAKLAASATGVAVSSTGYGVFVSDSGERSGSYSVTSSQDAYRILNQSLIAKAGRR